MTADEQPEEGAVAFFTKDHRTCDARWAAVEAAVEAHDPAGASAAWQDFDRLIRRHFEMEEQVLFPAFEHVTGMTAGPTMVMRMEHQQVRGLLGQMGASATGGDWHAVLDQGDTLLMLIQQHNAKEEAIVYPMADQHLAATWGDVASRLRKF
jgi:hemerythrin-like domain-containing protein